MHVFNKLAGTPSGPGAAVLFSSEHAFSMSSGLNEKSFRESSPSPTLKWSLVLVTDQAGLGAEKTLSYWVFSDSAAKSGEGLGEPVEGSKNGPTLALSCCLDLAKVKKAFGFDLIRRTGLPKVLLA